MTHHLPAGKEDGKDFDKHNRKTDPLGWNPDSVDRGHSRNIETDEPHRGGVEVGDSAADSLDSPAVGVVDVARLPENDRGDDPGPGQLPGHSRPPFPSRALCHLLFHDSSVDLGARNSPGAVPLAGNEPHKDSEEDLKEHSDANNSKHFGRIAKTVEAGDQALRLLFGGGG